MIYYDFAGSYPSLQSESRVLTLEFGVLASLDNLLSSVVELWLQDPTLQTPDLSRQIQ